MARFIKHAPTCETAPDLSTEWDARNNVVLGYVHALGAIAGVDVKPTFDPLGSALVSAKVLTQTQDQPFTDLAGQISNIIITGQVQEDLTKAIESTNASLDSATEALTLIDSSYTSTLHTEFDQTVYYYGSIIAAECKGAMSKKPGSLSISHDTGFDIHACDSLKGLSPDLQDTVFQQRQRFNDSLASVNLRLTAAAKYDSVLSDIRTTHQQLYDATQHKPTIQDYLAILQKDVIPLYQDVDALRKVTK